MRARLILLKGGMRHFELRFATAVGHFISDRQDYAKETNAELLFMYEQ